MATKVEAALVNKFLESAVFYTYFILYQVHCVAAMERPPAILCVREKVRRHRSRETSRKMRGWIEKSTPASRLGKAHACFVA